MPLTPDKIEVLNGVTVKTYLLTQHNPNKISLPKNAMLAPIGVTIHNTEAINVASNTTMAEQYTRATINGNMNTVRVHFYVDDTCAWQNLPINIDSWHAADGNGNGNRKTISFEVIGNSAKAEANAAKLAAYFLNKIGKTPEDGLFTHTYWLNVRDGKKGTIDYLNTLKHPYKTCPIYIIPHWSSFKNNVKTEFSKLNKTEVSSSPTISSQPAELFRVRKNWDDAKTQIGAYSSLENAKKVCREGYSVFNSKGEAVYSFDAAAGEKLETKKLVKENEENKKEKSDCKIDVLYQVYAGKKWQPQVKNSEDFAGIKGWKITGVAAKTTEGTLKYRVHQKDSNWMKWISAYNLNDLVHGYAGVPGIVIDAVQFDLAGIEGKQVRYRASLVGGDWLPWVTGVSDYAGIFGKAIDRIQIEII